MADILHILLVSMRIYWTKKWWQETAAFIQPNAGRYLDKLEQFYGTESGQTLQCSFSSVSTPPIARVGAFFSIFHDLQDIHAFAPLQTQNFRKKLPIFFVILQKILKILQHFGQILQKFYEISPEFHGNFELLKGRGLPGFFRGSSGVLPDVLQFSSRPMPSTLRPFS